VSEPIGREFAKELADGKFSLVLMGESLSSLDKLSKELIQKGTRGITLPVTIYFKFQTIVKNTLQTLEVRILVNSKRVMTHRDSTYSCLFDAFLNSRKWRCDSKLSSGLPSGVNLLYGATRSF